MPYSIRTKDGIVINNIPDNVPRDDQSLKDRVAQARAQREGQGSTTPSNVMGAPQKDAPPPSLEAPANATTPPKRGTNFAQEAYRTVAPVVETAAGGLGAAGDMALSLATGIGGQIAGGWGGINKILFGGTAEQAAQAVDAVSRTLTYTPKTEGGQTMATDLAGPMEALDNKMRDASMFIAGGNPELATVAYTAMNMLPVESQLGRAKGAFMSNLYARNAAAAAEKVWLEQGIRLGSYKMQDQIGDAVQRSAGGLPQARGDAIANLTDDVRGARTRAREERDAAFTRARQGNTYVDLSNVEELMRNVDTIIADYDAPNSSFSILDEDPKLRQDYEQVKSWLRTQQQAASAERAGPRAQPRPFRSDSTEVVPAGPRSGSADAIPMGQDRTDIVPSQSRQGVEPYLNTIPGQPLLPGPARPPATAGGRAVEPAGPLRTEQTITGRAEASAEDARRRAFIHLNELDQARRRIRNGLPAGGRANWTAGQRARMQIKGAIDNFIEKQFENDMIHGTKEDLDAWANARGLARAYRENFGPRTALYRLATDQKANPEDIRKYIFGLSHTGAKTEAAQVVQALKGVFGENSPQVNAVRMEFLADVLKPIRDKEGMEGIKDFLAYYKKINEDNPTLVKELSPFAANGLDDLARVARAAVNAGDPSKFTLSIPKMLARFAVGHQIARKGALVGASAGILEAVFGRSPAKVRRDMLNELIGMDTAQPLFAPNTVELQGLWAGAINEAFTREMEREDDNGNVQR